VKTFGADSKGSQHCSALMGNKARVHEILGLDRECEEEYIQCNRQNRRRRPSATYYHVFLLIVPIYSPSVQQKCAILE